MVPFNYIYQLNKQFRTVSDFIVGNYFEPRIDIALVTGGTSGLGCEIVKQLREQKAKVVVLDIHIPEDENKVEGVHYYECDVSNRVKVWEVHERIKKEIGIVSMLINNAGIAIGKELLDLSYDEIETTINVNLMSSFHTIKTFLPDMIDMKRGYIVTIASVLGYMSPARLSAYGASKSGLIALHESLTYELGPPSLHPKGVKTLLICPGQLRTSMFRGIVSPSRLLAPELDPKYVAKHLIKAIELGKRGEIKLPFYGNFLPIFRAFPWPIVEVVRKVSGIDKSMKAFKNTAKLVEKVNQKASAAGSSLVVSNKPSPLGYSH